jgi:hypothetical protein
LAQTGSFKINFRSININVIPSFGRIVNVVEVEKDSKVNNILNFRSDKLRPAELDSEL